MQICSVPLHLASTMHLGIGYTYSGEDDSEATVIIALLSNTQNEFGIHTYRLISYLQK